MSGSRRSAGALLVGASVVALLTGLSGSPAQAQSTYLDPITVVASRTEETVISALAGVSAIRGDQIGQLQPTRLSDIFFGTPSVTFQQRADDPGTAINIRGMQDFGRVAVVVDGARQNFQRTGHNADGIFYLEPELLAGADIARGPVANIYGSGAIGGVASFRTKDTQDVLRPGERYGALLHGMLGSNEVQAMGSAFLAARPVDNIDFMFGGTQRHRSDYRDGNGNIVPNSHFDVYTGIGKFNVRPAEGHELKFGAVTYDARFRNGLPPPPASATVYASQALNHIGTARWRYARPEDRLFDFDANAYWTKTEVNQTKIAGTSSASGPIGSERSFGIETTGADVHNTSRFDIADQLRTAMTLGGDTFHDKVNVTDPNGTGDVFTPNGQRTVSGAFAQFKTNYSTWLELITAARYDTYSLRGATGGTGSEGDRVSPKATLGITPIAWFTVYGTYAEGYRAPAVTEVFISGTHPVMFAMFDFLQNPNLKPEIGKTKEIGINIKHDSLFVPGDALRIKANVFRNDVENFIEQVQLFNGQTGEGGQLCNSPAGFCFEYQNVASARIEGVEFEGNYDAQDWFMGLAATKIRSRNLDNGLPLLKIQPAQVATTLGVRVYERKATFAVRWLWVDAKRPDEIPVAGLPPTDSYNLVNLYAGFQPNEDTLLSLTVDNILDVQYAKYLDVTTRGTTVVPSPGPGITVKGSLKVRFGNTFFKNG